MEDLLPSGQTVLSVGYTDPVDSALEQMQHHGADQRRQALGFGIRKGVGATKTSVTFRLQSSET